VSATARASILTGCSAAVQSLGGNVLAPSCGPGPDDVAGDALLGPLTANGGPTATRMPASDSPARDRAACTVVTDQRGVARPIGGACDSGAVELNAPLAAPPAPPVAKVAERDRAGVDCVAGRKRRTALDHMEVPEPAR
jgi:hypothetical protein